MLALSARGYLLPCQELAARKRLFRWRRAGGDGLARSRILDFPQEMGNLAQSGSNKPLELVLVRIQHQTLPDALTWVASQ